MSSTAESKQPRPEEAVPYRGEQPYGKLEDLVVPGVLRLDPDERLWVPQGMLQEVAWSPDENPLAFVCGPTSLVEEAAAALVSLGHDPTRVKTERFGATGG